MLEDTPAAPSGQAWQQSAWRLSRAMLFAALLVGLAPVALADGQSEALRARLKRLVGHARGLRINPATMARQLNRVPGFDELAIEILTDRGEAALWIQDHGRHSNDVGESLYAAYVLSRFGAGMNGILLAWGQRRKGQMLGLLATRMLWEWGLPAATMLSRYGIRYDYEEQALAAAEMAATYIALNDPTYRISRKVVREMIHRLGAGREITRRARERIMRRTFEYATRGAYDEVLTRFP